MGEKAEIILSAKDDTAQAVAAVKSNFLSLGQTLSGIDLVKGLGVTAVAAGFLTLTKSSIDYMASLHDMSIATGASVESLSAMKTAAKLSGTSLEEAAGSMKKLGIALGEAQLKGGDKARLFEQLGIDPKTTKDTGQAMFDLAKKLDAMPDKFKAMSVARDLLGRNVSLPFLQELAQMEALQAKVTTAQAAAADQFQDNVIRFKAGAGEMGNSIANSVLPGMNEILEFSLKVKKEWGALAAVIVGLGGGTALKGLGVELDPLKRAAQESTTAINELIAARKALADQTASADARKSQLGPLGQWIIDQKVGAAGEAVVAARARTRAALADEARAFAEDEKRNYEAYRRKKDGKDLPDGEAQKSKAPRDTRLEHMLKLGQTNLNAGLDSEEEQRLLATKRAMEDARKEFEALQRMLKVGEDNELAAYYETGGEEVMRLVGEQRALKTSLEDNTKFAREMGLTFASAFEDAVIGGKEFSDVLKGLFQDIQRIVLRNTITEPLGKEITKRIKGENDSGGLFASIKNLLGFATGGSFTVGGGGGTDSQLVAFRATPGEQVSIATPAQQGGGITVNIVEDSSRAGQVAQRQGEGGQNILEVFVDRVRAAVAGDISRGAGPIPAAMASTYGLSRAAGAY